MYDGFAGRFVLVSNIDKIASASQAAVQGIVQGNRRTPQKAFLLEAQKVSSGESRQAGTPAKSEKTKALSISQEQGGEQNPDPNLPRGSIVDILA